MAKTDAAIDRYLAAFEDGTLDPEDLAERLATLKARARQLSVRRDDLTSQLASMPTAPPPATLEQVADHIDQIISSGTDKQRKALIEALLAQVKIIGPGRIVPVFRIPQPRAVPASLQATRSDAVTRRDAEGEGYGVRAMTNLVGPVGFEPTLAGS